MSGLIVFTLIVISQSIPVIIVAVILWFALVGLLRSMAKADPLMSRVYLRHIRYRDYYRPHATPYREK